MFRQPDRQRAQTQRGPDAQTREDEAGDSAGYQSRVCHSDHGDFDDFGSEEDLESGDFDSDGLLSADLPPEGFSCAGLLSPDLLSPDLPSPALLSPGLPSLGFASPDLSPCESDD